MTEPQTITTDHVQALLGSSAGAKIMLVEGRVEVLDADAVGSQEHQGALEVVSREDLADRLGEDPTPDDLAGQAEALTAAVQLLGG